MTYQTVANAVRKRLATLSHLHSNPFYSLRAWAQKLKNKGWNVRLVIPDNGLSISFCFFSKWQKERLTRYGQDIICLDLTHNTTNNFGHFVDLKLSLFTFVVRSPVTGKGLPVIWWLSSDEKA